MHKYSKIQIYYFSGTGNAYNIAKWFAAKSNEKGISTTIINIAGIEEFPIEKPSENNRLFNVPNQGILITSGND